MYKKISYPFFIKSAVFLYCILLLSSCQPPFGEGKVAEFRYTDQSGRPFDKKELENKVWIADFIFTSCKTVCPPMTANMRALQSMAEEKRIPIQIVSFSVDPDVDTPEKLKEFSRKFQVKENNWHFLTGYKNEEISQFARDSFKTIVKKPENEDQVIHGTSFYLVDKKGRVSKNYSGTGKVPFEQILSDVQKLEKQH
ncbi:SCO family protein [Metabacillus sp. GX 13764]|uniref:SCO family protein n=1 Tax=Metabacillus kandeliae TaxID=2900151 RepID=UPI001E5875B2|nr:SCO family protein [Metabacillus kandeliae]MCD7033467.1 SCO family protein [Metabacillus kandeliae]